MNIKRNFILLIILSSFFIVSCSKNTSNLGEDTLTDTYPEFRFNGIGIEEGFIGFISFYDKTNEDFDEILEELNNIEKSDSIERILPVTISRNNTEISIDPVNLEDKNIYLRVKTYHSKNSDENFYILENNSEIYNKIFKYYEKNINEKGLELEDILNAYANGFSL